MPAKKILSVSPRGDLEIDATFISEPTDGSSEALMTYCANLIRQHQSLSSQDLPSKEQELKLHINELKILSVLDRDEIGKEALERLKEMARGKAKKLIENIEKIRDAYKEMDKDEDEEGKYFIGTSPDFEFEELKQRTLVIHYYHAKEIGVEKNDAILAALWGNPIGRVLDQEALARTLCLFPIEIGLLLNRENKIISFGIGESNNVEMEEWSGLGGGLRDATFVHNHPEGSPLSVADIVFCINRNVGKVHAVGLHKKDAEIQCELRTYQARIKYRDEENATEAMKAIGCFVAEDGVVLPTQFFGQSIVSENETLAAKIKTLEDLDMIDTLGTNPSTFELDKENLYEELRDNKHNFLTDGVAEEDLDHIQRIVCEYLERLPDKDEP